MADGHLIHGLARYGFTKILLSAPTLRMVTGNIPTMDGHGCLILNGDGHHSTMADGNTTLIMGGCGYLDMNGQVHG